MWKICSCRHMRNCHMENFPVGISCYACMENFKAKHHAKNAKHNAQIHAWKIYLCCHIENFPMENFIIYNVARGRIWLENISVCIRKILRHKYISCLQLNRYAANGIFQHGKFNYCKWNIIRLQRYNGILQCLYMQMHRRKIYMQRQSN